MKTSPILNLMRWVLITAILAFALTASAEPLILENNPCYELSGYMQTLSDPTNRMTVKQVADRNDWNATQHGKVPNLGLTTASFWIHFSLANRSDDTRKFYVALEYPVINSVTFYAKDGHGGFREEHTGSITPASAGIVYDRHFLFPVILESGQTSEIYMKINSASSMTFPLRVLSDQALLQKSIRDYTMYGALFGMIVLVMFYFISVGSFLYRGTPIWLALYGVFFGLHTAIRGGFIRLLLPDSALELNNLLQLIAITGLFFTGAKFFRLFLSLKKNARLLDHIMAFFQYLSLTFIMLPLLPNPAIIAVTLVLIVVNPLFSIALAFFFWRKGVPNAGFFAVGWIVAHFVAVYDFFRIHGVFAYEPLGEWPIPFSLFIALLFLSVAFIRQNAVDHRMAETDSLTRLANRRKLDEALHQEWDRCKRLQSPLSVIMADMDHFKQFNDSFGHRAGDQCLRRIAEILSNHTRRTGDLAARYGGEEFLLLFPHLNTSQAFAVAERIRDTIEKQADRQHAGKVTISMGVATAVPSEGITPEDLVMEADKALYDAKHAGRNQTMASRAATG